MDKMTELQNEALAAATEHIKQQRKRNECNHLKIICLTVVVCVGLVSSAILGCFAIYTQQETIREQQYALNMQYASLMEYISNAEITTEKDVAEAGGDGSIAVVGDGNTTAGGDIVNAE